MAKRILVVEDDPSILRGLELNLQMEGYTVLTATDGRQALAMARSEKPDLVVLDIMLPHANGFEVCRSLRKDRNDVPIILLSAKVAEMDVVMGLDLGADDYVTKPFRVTEVLARVKAHLRRRDDGGEALRFADVVVDLDGRSVIRGGEPVELTAKEFDLLKFLVEREGRAVTREVILNEVWGYGYFGTDRTVDNFIQRLRTKLDTPGEPRHIVTVRGIGYRFVTDPE